jgi:aryl-alcohol dehydrogenase-like predicted oxidoreductase
MTTTAFKTHVKLGRTNMTVSRLGLASGYGIDAKSIERAYHDHGVNYFYWSTPRRQGMRDALRNLVKTDREKIHIVLQTYDHLGLTVKRAINKGMQSLGIDYVDVILLGWHNRRPPGKILDDAQAMVQSGEAKYIAMSGHNRKLFGDLARDKNNPIDIFMIRYNAAHPGAETDIFPFLPDENRPGVTIYTATCWGKLLNPKKMPGGESPMTAADCYRFALSHPEIDLCLTGPKDAEQFNQGIKALELGPLSEEELARFRSIGKYVHG